MKRYPDIQVQLTLNDRFIDLIEEGFDITIRISTPSSDGALTTQVLAPIHRVIYASPEYLKERGEPAYPSELNQHDCLEYGHLATRSQWRLLDKESKPLTVSLRCKGCSNNGEVLREEAIAGVGITLLPTFIIDQALKSKQLQIILPDYCPLPLTAYLSYATNRHLSTKIQLLTAFLQDWFRQPSWL